MASTLQNIVQPAQDFFSYQKQPYPHTQYEPVNSAQSSPYTPHSSTYVNTFQQEYKRPEVDQGTLKRYRHLQRITGIVFNVADVCSCLITLLIECVMVYILIKFYKTRTIPAPGRTGPWAKETKLWPTYMLAAAALATLLLAAISLILACRKRKKTTTRARLTLKVTKVIIHVGCWIAIAAFYRIAKTGKDLWGWSCSEKAAAIQQYYNGPLNFEQLCNIQTSSWIMSLAEVGVKILLAVIGFFLQYKVDGIKRDIIRDIGEAGWDAYSQLS